MAFAPRPTQAEILKYTGGTMGISAVPGSGKTHTLSALAALLVEKRQAVRAEAYAPDRFESEILIVTFSNSAVANFSARIAGFLSEKGMVPGIGYRVRTLHGMATDIVRGRAENFGIDPDFVILDETACEALLLRAVDQWLEKDARRTYDSFLDPEVKPNQREKYYAEKWRKDVTGIARNVISQAKDYLLTPEKMRNAIDALADETQFGLLSMICDIYSAYQMMLKTYPALDYADLMFYAYDILEKDPGYRALLQKHWPVILEDEAQDSSLIQEKVLRLLTQGERNWVRVGDPNQAINETFTTADPKFLLDFLKEADKTVDLFNSGRSSVSILRQANRLIRWTQTAHPARDCQSALVEPFIKTTPPDDPQRNPKDNPRRVRFDAAAYVPADEIEQVCRLAVEQVKNHPEETLAILVPSNEFGAQFAAALEKFPVDVIEVLKSTRKTRGTANILSKILTWLSLPLNQKNCLELFEILYHHNAEKDFYLSPEHCKIARDRLLSIQTIEDFIYPLTEHDLRKLVDSWNDPPMVLQTLFSFRFFLRRWLDARFLKIDQLILLIAQDLFESSDDLSTANQLGRILAQMANADPSLRLNSLADKLREAAANSSLYTGSQGADSQFDPDLYRGKIVVTTYHRAKGLEWDQVFLTSCNDYDFPSGLDAESKDRPRRMRGLARPHYVRDSLDIQAEALQQLKIIGFPEDELQYVEGMNSRKAFNDMASERLRLLYVGITRAKKGLHFSWNTGRFGNQTEALAVKTLRIIQQKESR